MVKTLPKTKPLLLQVPDAIALTVTPQQFMALAATNQGLGYFSQAVLAQKLYFL